MSENIVQDRSHINRTEIPNIAFELGLTPVQLAVYLILKRIAGDVGYCIKSCKNIADDLQINIKTFRTARDSLTQIFPIIDKPLILIKKRLAKEGDQDTNEITIIDIWTDNTDFFRNGGRVKNGGTPKNYPRVVQNLVGGVVQNLVHKEDPIEEDLIKEDDDEVYTTQPPPPPSSSSKIILNKQAKSFETSESDIAEWKQAFPNLDIFRQLQICYIKAAHAAMRDDWRGYIFNWMKNESEKQTASPAKSSVIVTQESARKFISTWKTTHIGMTLEALHDRVRIAQTLGAAPKADDLEYSVKGFFEKLESLLRKRNYVNTANMHIEGGSKWCC